jgi:hypothetical protein
MIDNSPAFSTPGQGAKGVESQRDGWKWRQVSRPLGTFSIANRNPGVENAGLLSFVPSGQKQPPPRQILGHGVANVRDDATNLAN